MLTSCFPTSDSTVALAEDQMLTVLPKASALAARTWLSVSDLADMPFVLSDTGCTSLIEPIFADQRLAPRTVYRMSQVLTILGIVQEWNVISVLPELSVPDNLDQIFPRVVVRPFWPRLRRRIGQAVRDVRKLLPVVEAFLAVTRDTASRSGIGAKVSVR